MNPVPFHLERRSHDLRFRRVRLAARRWLTPTYVRVRLAGPELRGFDSPGADDHIRVFFPDAEAATIDELRAAPSREYTPLAWGEDEAGDGWLDLEFAIHGIQPHGGHGGHGGPGGPGGADGVAAAWAATAEIGAPAGIGGPRGSMTICGRPDAWLLAGDETAVPAMRRFAHRMDAAAVGRILVEVPDAAHELPIDAPPGVAVEQLHRAGRGGDARPGGALAARLDELGTTERPAGDVFAFVAAEQAIVKTARRVLLDRWSLDADRIVVKGYWKNGETEYHAPH
ncbi:siderophore-interacting protein [Microbacterium flavum]|uniref:Siderophore-interacting protein n=1 Tax=Microbacterium flavum TaxID=415216 RepID=A0ABS5XQ04_9MICO|nr:siderophore-interacting protein [Microbacterium flavum]MBT8796613.1 siderophore-interacting protein [Microbacterium flavum]